MKKRLLIFHPALAPYRLDQFNDLSVLYDVEVVFLFENLSDNKFDQNKLSSQLKCRYSFLLKGISHKNRVFRFGVLKKIKQFKPDIIWGYEYSFTTQYLLLLKKLGILKQKLGSTIDDNIEMCYSKHSTLHSLARKYTVKQLDYTIVLSETVADYYHKTFSIRQSNIIISPILQNEQRLRKNKKELEDISAKYLKQYRLKGKKVLLYVGRFVSVKALPDFIKNISSIFQTEEDLRIILIGEGNEKPNIQKIIDEYAISDKILLPGRYEGNELYAWYLCASGFVLPSISEPFGAVVNEALIFGLNVFCSCYAGVAVLINSDNGVIFDPLKSDETKEKFMQFLNLMPLVDNPDLEQKKSLMEDYQERFVKEWAKM